MTSVVFCMFGGVLIKILARWLKAARKDLEHVLPSVSLDLAMEVNRP